MKEVNDVREYEDEDASKAAEGLLNYSQAENNDDGAGHHITAQRWAASFFFFYLTERTQLWMKKYNYWQFLFVFIFTSSRFGKKVAFR